MASHPFVSPTNDYLIEEDITRPNTSTGEDEAAAGLVNLEGRLSLTPGGSAIHATLAVSLTERAGTPGRYFGVLQGTDLAANLPAGGTTVYVVITDATNVKLSVPKKVVAERAPD